MLVAVLAVAGVGPVGSVGGPGDALRVTAFDVGQGDAILLRAPGATVLVDVGPPRSRLVRDLRRAGVRTLDLLVLTHGDADHVGGLEAVLGAVDVAAAWWRPPSPMAAADPALTALGAHDAPPVHAPVAGERHVVGELVLDVLAPPAGRPWAWADREDNETSVVVRASWRGRTVLLAGDVERHAQGALLAARAAIDVDVLVVPHHGSRTSDPVFLAATRPAAAVVSAGRGNPFGHPHVEIVAQLEALGATVHRTDRDGTVELVLLPP